MTAAAAKDRRLSSMRAWRVLDAAVVTSSRRHEAHCHSASKPDAAIGRTNERDSTAFGAQHVHRTRGISLAATGEQEEQFMRMTTRFVLAAVFLSAAGAATANAQVIDPMTFKTTFPFVAENTTLPAGDYTVTPLDDDPSILKLSNGKVSVLLETEGDRATRTPSKTEVIFNKYGDTYVLHEIVDPAAEGGVVMLPARAEKRHQKTYGTPTPLAVPAGKTSEK
jgi:hypothetical protein